MMEHGFHGFFPQYYNLFSLVDELKIRQNFKSLNFYSVVYKDHYQPEVFRPSRSAFPWNVVDLAISSPNRLKWGINLTHLKHLQVFREITGFRNPQSYERLDQMSVAEWVADDFPQGCTTCTFLPFAKSSLNAPDRLSAGELMQFFHFYFFGNPEGWPSTAPVRIWGAAWWTPWWQRLKPTEARCSPASALVRWPGRIGSNRRANLSGGRSSPPARCPSG
jgi:isorenieratene synthase